MQAKSVPGCGLIAVATQDFPRGAPVHACASFVNIPSAAVIRARSACCGCYSPVASIKKLALCKSCAAPYCCAECREQCSQSHALSGECEVIRKVVVGKEETVAGGGLDTDLLLIAAAVIKRAEIEGHLSLIDASRSSMACAGSNSHQQQQQSLPMLSSHPFPVPTPTLLQRKTAKAQSEQQRASSSLAATGSSGSVKPDEKKKKAAAAEEQKEEEEEEEEEGVFGFFEDESKQQEADAQIKKKERERILADIELVRTAPRECIADAMTIPNIISSSATGSSFLATSNTTAAGAAGATSASTAANSSIAQLLMSLVAPLFPCRPAAMLLQRDGGDDGGATEHDSVHVILKQDEQVRFELLAQQTAAAPPSFAEFCFLVSNIGVTPVSELERYDRIRKRFENIFLTSSPASDHHHHHGGEEKKQPQRSLYINPSFTTFFRHVCSAIHCNCFGFFDTSDVLKGTGVFLSASLFNHSCVPNLLRRVSCGKHQVFYAARDIKKGEELAISYATPFEGAFREQLLRQYRFWCDCPEHRSGSSNNEDDDQKKKVEVEKQRPRCTVCFAKGDLRPLLPTSSRLFECDVCFSVCLLPQ